MATDESLNGNNAEDADMLGEADWAEALVDQKEATDALDDAGGVLSGDTAGRMPGTGGSPDGQINDIKMVLDIPVQLSVELGRTRVSIKHILQFAI